MNLCQRTLPPNIVFTLLLVTAVSPLIWVIHDGDNSEGGHPIRLFIHVGSEVSGAEELEETPIADGPSPEPGLLSNHVYGSHWVPALGDVVLNSFSSAC